MELLTEEQKMFTTIEQFEKNWAHESKVTQNVFNTLTDASLSQSVDEGHRNLGRMAWHIVNTIPEMINHTGLEFDNINPNTPVPKSAKEIKEAYANVSGQLLNNIKKNWTDATLQQEDDMYGEKWKRGVTLLILIQHEIHHRGQMTVLMRQAGLKVPSIYGPAKEGWVDYGMDAPEV